MAGCTICACLALFRWISAGALYTFTRNHNTLGAAPQELYRWPAVAAAARKALALRYRLLPYIYTCMYRVSADTDCMHRLCVLQTTYTNTVPVPVTYGHMAVYTGPGESSGLAVTHTEPAAAYCRSRSVCLP
jgi:hypothetical protein